MEFLLNHLEVVFKFFLNEIYGVLLTYSHALTNFCSIYSAPESWGGGKLFPQKVKSKKKRSQGYSINKGER